MADYIEKLIMDLPEQFKERPKLEALLKAIGRQMNEIAYFYEQLNLYRAISSATGDQLDAIGDILVLSRQEARLVMKKSETLNDEDYRRMLIYKTQLNFGDGTYRSITECIKIIRGGMLGFSLKEEADSPAMIILETEESAAVPEVLSMLETPVPRAGGVGLIVRANDGADIGIGTGLTSQVTVKQLEYAEQLDWMTGIIWLVDENEVILMDEDYNVLVDNDGVLNTVEWPKKNAIDVGEGDKKDDTEEDDTPRHDTEGEEGVTSEENEGEEEGGSEE